MRRVLGATFTGLGAFFLVLALLGRFYLPGQVIKFPLNEYTVTTLTGTNASYFSQQTGTEVTGASVQASSTTQGDVSAGNSSTAVWNDVIGIFDVTTARPPADPIQYSSERLAFDRRTAELVNCSTCGAEVGTNNKVKFSGLGYVWPLGAQKKTYQIFDTTLLKPVPVTYSGIATINGFKTYVYVERVSNQQFGTISLPGSLAGIPDQLTVTLPEYLTATNTYYVDPGTGSPIKVVENQDVSLVNPATGQTALTLLKGTLTTTPTSIASAINTAKSGDTEITWLQDLGPLIALILGVLLIVFGIVLIVSAERDDYEYEYDEEEVPTQA